MNQMVEDLRGLVAALGPCEPWVPSYPGEKPPTFASVMIKVMEHSLDQIEREARGEKVGVNWVGLLSQ